MSRHLPPEPPSDAALDSSQSEDEFSQRELVELEATMNQLVYAPAPRQESKQRLMDSVSKAPLRYAPFFARTAQLFRLDEQRIEAEFARLNDPTNFRFSGWPGVQQLEIAAGPGLEDAETLIVKCAPGVRIPRHKHTAPEAMLLLEGGYYDDTGREFHAGSLHEMPAGSEHHIQAFPVEGCLFASVVHGRRFSSWPMRVLAVVLGR